MTSRQRAEQRRVARLGRGRHPEHGAPPDRPCGRRGAERRREPDLRKAYEETLAVATDDAARLLAEGTAFDDSAASGRRFLVIALVLGAVVSAAACWLLSREITPRVKRQVAALEAMAAGDLTVRVEDDSADEIGAMAHALNVANGSVNEVVQSIRGNAGDRPAQPEVVRAPGPGLQVLGLNGRDTMRPAVLRNHRPPASWS